MGSYRSQEGGRSYQRRREEQVQAEGPFSLVQVRARI